MFSIICPNCNKENLFHIESNIPTECTFCWGIIPVDIPIIRKADKREITGLTIIYQLTQQQIEIPLLNKVILGREHCGSNVFSQIQSCGKLVVSRKHCSIEFKDGNFYLLDEGSLNGTFYGMNKLSCKNLSYLIEDGCIFFIGEEAFNAKINFREIFPQQQAPASLPENVNTIEKYRCNDINCSGYESQTFTEICPICGSFKSLIAIYL